MTCRSSAADHHASQRKPQWLRATAHAQGIDPARLVDIFADTSGGPNMLKVRGPAIAGALRGEVTSPVTFDVDLIRKDLRTMLEEGSGLGVELPLTTRVLECYDAAARDGLGKSDATMLPAHWLNAGHR